MDGFTSISFEALHPEIVSRDGDKRIGTLRGIYGSTFAEGFDDTPFLSQILWGLDEQSKQRLLESL
ncbi:MAG TPA: hypothetical protein VL574_12840 [Stellaceae bacterium]|nr:hypothetical protein [Stellaceae bacterium]